MKKLSHTLYDYLVHQKLSDDRFLVKYDDEVEDFISSINDDVAAFLPDNKKYLSRWVCLKLLDDNFDVCNALISNFSIDTSMYKVFEGKFLKIKSKLSESGFDFSSMRDSVVMNIVRTAEDIRKEVCVFADNKYNSRDRKLDKVLTSKRFGIPIMLMLLAVVFWITITGANYPSSLLSTFFGFIQGKLLVLFEACHIPEFWTNLLVLRYVSDCYLGCLCDASSYGYFLPYFYFT